MTNSFKDISDKLHIDIKEVENLIFKISNGKSPLIYEISNHLISSGGKRIRPILLILCAKICGLNNDSRIYSLASAVELIHSATLLHDDVVDNSEIRRGKKTASAIWDNKFSILVGDFIFASAFELMVESKSLEVLKLLAKTSSTIADGEVMQYENSNKIDINLTKYIDIIESKTAILFSASCLVPAIITNQNDIIKNSLANFGKNLGILFQIVDDILDYTGDKNIMGKDVGDDFFEAKITLPIILTLEKASIEDQNIITQQFQINLNNNQKNNDNFNKILELINKYNAIELSINLANKYYNLAKSDLEIFFNNSYYEDLTSILNYSMERIS